MLDPACAERRAGPYQSPSFSERRAMSYTWPPKRFWLRHSGRDGPGSSSSSADAAASSVANARGAGSSLPRSASLAGPDRNPSPAAHPRRRNRKCPGKNAKADISHGPVGEVAEWLKAPHSKCGIRVTVSGVRIPPSPPLDRIKSLLLNDNLVFTAPLAPKSVPKSNAERADLGRQRPLGHRAIERLLQGRPQKRQRRW